MRALTKLTAAGQISLPAHIRKHLHLSAGDYLAIEVTEDGKLILSPQVLVPREESFFFRSDWQEAEREADADIAAGRVRGPFKDADELLADLTRE